MLEEGPTLGGGTIVRVSNKEVKRKGVGNNDDLKEFDVGFQPLGLAFGFRRTLDTILRFRTEQHSKLSNEPLRWVRVGLADAALAAEIVNMDDDYSNSGKVPFHNDQNKSSIEWDESQQTVYVGEMVRVGDRGPLIPIPCNVSNLAENLLEFIPEMATSSQLINTLTRVINDEVLNIFKLRNMRKQSQKAAKRTKHISTLLNSNDAVEENCNALGKTVEDIFKHILSPEALEILSSIFGEENILGKDLSVSAYCNYFMNITSHPCYPVGGFGRILNGLVEVIEQAGGELRTNVPGYQLLCCNADGADRDSGGNVAVKGVKICSFRNAGGRCNDDADVDSLIVSCPVVVSATGALDTYYRRVGAADLKDAGGIPSDLQNVHEGRPRCHLLLEFEGNWVSLKGSSFRLRVIRNAAAPLDSEIEQCYDSPNNKEWLSITFMEPRDPDTWTRPSTRCVISAELPEDCCLRPSHEGSSQLCRPADDTRTMKSCKIIQRMQALMLATLYKEFPQTSTAKVLLQQWVEDRLPRLSHTPGTSPLDFYTINTTTILCCND